MSHWNPWYVHGIDRPKTGSKEVTFSTSSPFFLSNSRNCFLRAMVDGDVRRCRESQASDESCWATVLLLWKENLFQHETIADDFESPCSIELVFFFLYTMEKFPNFSHLFYWMAPTAYLGGNTILCKPNAQLWLRKLLACISRTTINNGNDENCVYKQT